MVNNKGYLIDEQFLRRLKILRKYIDTIEEPFGYNDTTTGYKNTEVHVGFCNQDVTTIPEDMRLWKDRPKVIKYRDENLSEEEHIKIQEFILVYEKGYIAAMNGIYGYDK